MNHLKRLSAGLLLLAGLAFMGHVATTYAQPPAAPKKDAPAKDRFVKPKWNDQQIAFEMRAKPWHTVFEWFTDQTGMPFASKYPAPAGTFTFINPKDPKTGEPRKYTLAEIFDTINEILQAEHKFTLIRRDNTIAMFPADEQIPGSMVRRITVPELKECGLTEIVEVVIPAVGQNADELAPELKRLLGDFAHVTPLTASNQLIVRADVASLMRHLPTILPSKDNPNTSVHTFTHKCIYVRASYAEALLTKSLGAQQVVDRISAAPPAAGGPGGAIPPGAGPGGADGGGGGFGPRGGAGSAPTRTRVVRPHTVSSDDATNTVFITGPSDKIETAKTILSKLDAPRFLGDKGILEGPPTFKYHEVRSGGADQMAKIIGEIYKSNSQIRVSVSGPTKLFVYADPQTHFEINALLNADPLPEPETAQIPLTRLEASAFADSLKAMFPESKNLSPYIEGDKENNSIRIRGTPEQVKAIKAVIQQLDDAGSVSGGNVSIINLDKGSAATVAEAIQLLFPGIRDNPLKVVLPGSLGSDPPLKKSEPIPAPDVKPAPKSEPKNKTSLPLNQDALRRLMYQTSVETQEKPDKGPFFDPQDKKTDKKEVKPASKKPPVTITAFGSRIIITSDDPDAIATIRGLIRLLVNTEAGPGDFEVIKLKYANATEVAKLLDEAYNGPKNQGGAGGAGRGGPGGGIIGMMMNPLAALGGGTSGRTEIIRVVADPSTNSLLIRAKPIDMLTIRNLVRTHIDRLDSESDAVIKTFVIGPLKNANAGNVAEIIEKVYRESMSARSTSVQASSAPGFQMFSAQRQTDPIADRHALLSFSVDSSTNSLVVACPTTLYKDIENLVLKLDQASGKIERVLAIKDVDVAIVQQVLDIFAVHNAQQQQQARGQTGGGGFTGGAGFTGGTGGGFTGRTGGGFTGGTGGTGFTPGGGFPGGFGGGGFTPGGGGFTGGGGRGPGGGGFGGGGGGAAPTGGGGRTGGARPGGAQSRGPDFFVPRVTDDPEASLVFFDPSEEQEQPTDRVNELLRNSNYAIHPPYFVGLSQALEQDKEKDQGKQPEKKAGPGPDGKFLHPDLEEVQRITRLIAEDFKGAEIDFEIVPVRFGDPTQITYTLNQLYGRVNVPQRFSVLLSGLRGGVTQITLPSYIAGGGTGAPAGGQAAVLSGGQPANVVLIPQPRLGGILVATARTRMADIKREISRLDQMLSDTVALATFELKYVPASRVAASINLFIQSRYPGDTINNTQIRVTFDDHSNTVFVQAPPADMTQIRGLIAHMDSDNKNAATNELRVIPLKNAVSDDLARLLVVTIANGALTAQNQGLQGLQGAAALNQGGAGAAGGIGGGGGFGGGAGGGAAGATGTVVGSVLTAPAGVVTKTSVVRLITRDKNGKPIESGVLDDIRINSEPRTNSLVISAPEKAMQLVLGLIRELDVPPLARSEINVFTLKKTDATQLALTLQRLFLNTSGTAAGGTAAGGGGAVGLLGTATNAASKPLQLTVQGLATPDGAPIIDLRLSVDERTNSLIVAGSRNDLNVVDTIVAKLEDTDIGERRFQAVRLRNSQAVDVANALTPFITAMLAVFTKDNQSTPYLDLQRNIVVQAEPISNSLLISATPEYFDRVVQMVAQLDTTPAQVVVQVLIAEVTMNGNEEFGVELGFQSPVLFNRGIYPPFTGAQTFNSSAGLLGGATSPVIYTTTTPAAGSPLTVTTANTNYPLAIPGFPFGNPVTPLGNNPTVSPTAVGMQGLSSLGVGRVSPTSGIGGFVFSASSNSISVLVRALKTQSRLDVLSRPQMMTLDNQTAYINIGQQIPLNNGSNATATGIITQTIIRQAIGVQLQVTPHITPDGRVTMRIIPDVSTVDSTAFPLGNGIFGTSLNVQHMETTVSALDGETIMLGGMITKQSAKSENKVPWLGDLPGLGSLFRYRTESKIKTELIIIMTPHIVRNPQEADQVLADEARRISWVLSDVARVHGSANMGPIAPPIPCEPQPGLLKHRIFPGASAPNSMPPMVMPEGTPASQTFPPIPAGQGRVSPSTLTNQSVSATPPLPTIPTPAALPGTLNNWNAGKLPSTVAGENYTVQYESVKGTPNLPSMPPPLPSVPMNGFPAPPNPLPATPAFIAAPVRP